MTGNSECVISWQFGGKGGQCVYLPAVTQIFQGKRIILYNQDRYQPFKEKILKIKLILD